MNVEKERWLSLTLWLTNILTTLPAGVTRDIFKIVLDKMAEIETHNPIK
jgi:hypothetical protein